MQYSSSSSVLATSFSTPRPRYTIIISLHLFLILSHFQGRGTSPLLVYGTTSTLDHLLKNNGWPVCDDGASSNDTSTTFKSNLNLLFASLSKNTPRTGFSSDTIGGGGGGGSSTRRDRVYGLALCRGDVTGQECQPCLDTAAKDLLQYCPSKRAATIWYDDCLLRYADADFFAVPTGYQTALYNSEDVASGRLARFNEVLITLLNGLAQQAAFGAPRMFLTGEATVDTASSSKIYGLVQCTRDLSRGDCYLCLKDEIRYSQSGKIGARFLGGSCWVRYESALFFNVSSRMKAATLPAGSTAAPSKN